MNNQIQITYILYGIITSALLAETVSGYRTFNATNVCCDGNVGPASMWCCGKLWYDSSQALCCGDTLTAFLREEIRYYSCCTNTETKETKPYNFLNYTCCSGTISEIKDKNKSYECCNNQAFDINESFCCNGVIVSIGTGLRCCGTYQFNPKTQICASYYDQATSQSIYQVKEVNNNHTAACKLELYDSKTHACCAGVIVSNTKGLNFSCCGKTSVYDYKTEVCCVKTGRVLQIPPNMIGAEIYPQCCQDQVFQANVKTCCYDKLVDPSEECTEHMMKCNGVPFKQSPNDSLACCNNQTVYNTSEKWCCGQVYDMKDLSIKGCCNTVNSVYDLRAQTCGNNGVVSRSKEELEAIDNGIEACGPMFPPMYN